MGRIFSISTRTEEADALETPAEPDRAGLTLGQQELLTRVFYLKCKENTGYGVMNAKWIEKNFQALCYYKPKLIEKIDTNIVQCLTIYKNKLFSGGDDRTIRVWNLDE